MRQSGARTHHPSDQAAMQRGERFKKAVCARAAGRGLFTDVAIAEAAGVSTNTLANWWKGKGLEIGTLTAVADALDARLADLFDEWQGRTPGQESELVTALEAQTKAISLLADRLDRMTSPEWLAECVAASLTAVEQRLATGQGGSGPASADPVSSRRDRSSP